MTLPPWSPELSLAVDVLSETLPSKRHKKAWTLAKKLKKQQGLTVSVWLSRLAIFVAIGDQR